MTLLKRMIFLILLPAVQIAVNAQDINSSYYLKGVIKEKEKGLVFFSFRNNNFLKNNEYFNEFTEGITYFGSMIQPELSYDLSAKARFSAGWFLRYYYGQDQFNASLPVFRFDYQPVPGIRLVFGQLEGLLDHELIEPIYGSDNYFSRNPENGIQLKTIYRRLQSDTWISWDHFILPGDPQKEEITAGTHIVSPLYTHSPFHSTRVHLQATIHHLGGQVDQSSAPLQTRLSIAPGLEFIRKSFLIKDLDYTLAAYLIQSSDQSSKVTIPYKKGFAAYSFGQAKYKGLRGLLSYFHGEYYFSPLGDPLFQSISTLNSWYMKDSRNLLGGKLLYDRQLAEGIFLGFRLESYLDLDTSRLDFCYGLNIRTNALWHLHRTSSGR